MTFSNWIAYVLQNWKKEEGQTMAEYTIALCVIAITTVAAFTALSDVVGGQLHRAAALLP